MKMLTSHYMKLKTSQHRFIAFTPSFIGLEGLTLLIYRYNNNNVYTLTNK